jgi:hypothetical protein
LWFEKAYRIDIDIVIRIDFFFTTSPQKQTHFGANPEKRKNAVWQLYSVV